MTSSRNIDACVDINKMVKTMSRKLNSFWSVYEHVDMESRHCPIFRVPQHILEVDRISYEPIFVSIGPYHRGTPAVQTMEKEKWLYLDWILKLNCKQSIYAYVKKIAGVEKLAKNSYSDVKMDRKTFLQMLLLDGCFILANIDVNLQRTKDEKARKAIVAGKCSTSRTLAEDMDTLKTTGYPQEYALGNTIIDMDDNHIVSGTDIIGHKDTQQSGNANAGDWCGSFAWHDMFLLENQIPFFVVEKIYELAVDGHETNSLTYKATECIQDVLRHYPKVTDKLNSARKFHHLLHVCHLCLKPSQVVEDSYDRPQRPRCFHWLLDLGHKYLGFGKNVDQNQRNVLPFQPMDCFQDGQLPGRWRRAVQYHEAGVKFKKREYDSNHGHSLLDVRFFNGVLEIPLFPIDENTESLFKNLIAFEQTDPTFGNDFTAYVIFMSQFASTPEDVSLLGQKGIIVHMTDGDAEVSALFMRLTKQVTFDSYGNYYLKSLCEMLEEHYQSQLNRWMAWLWHNHFSNPWLVLAVLAAIVVLVCTVVQTVFTILSYVEPRA